MGQKISITMVKPKDLNDAKAITDSLLDGVPVIVNLEETDEDKIKQIIDFIHGKAVTAGCQKEQIGQKIFIFTPKTIEIESVDWN